MNRTLAISLFLPLFACQDAHQSKPWSTPEARAIPGPFDLSPAAEPTATAPFVVHEWGTYTSVQGSNGEVLSGMHYEEEALPGFVYGRVPPPPPSRPANKQVEGLLLDGITQKLETPVIYFYGAPAHVDVDVKFPHGVISQWYPNATSFAPEVYQAEFSPDDILNGRMTWSLDVLPYDETDGMIAVPPDDVWAPSRNVAAQPVRFGEEVEKFIFYRGLGRFDTPFRVTSQGSTLALHNDSEEVIADAWILHWDGERGAVWEVGAIGAGDEVHFTPTPKELPQPDYLDTARAQVTAGLVRSGLTEDESWAMVDTWDRSYFRSTGLRVLYVAPRAWADDLLPLTVTPTPDELVRTLVGRVEVVTEDDERALLADLEGENLAAIAASRFTEPRLQRALQLTDDPNVREKIFALIAQARATVQD